MIKGVLLDLDNTLLANPDSAFAVEYLGRIDRFFADTWEFPNLSQVLLQTLRAMNGQRDMQQTNAEIALDVISAAVERDITEIQAAFAQFYAEVYPQLRHCTQAVFAASALVEHLLNSGLAIVIATNPIYPAAAIRQRLEWAGLPDKPETYALVTHSENMHFTKSSAAYYGEIVARVGIEPDEAIMVGDSLTNDITPARKAGLSVYHIASEPGHTDTFPTCTLADFYHLVTQENWLESIPPPPITPDMIEPEMSGNIGALFGMLADVKPHFWEQHPDPDEWSLIQIVCHLAESEITTQRPRLARILREENPFLVAPAPPPGPHEAAPCNRSGLQVASEFAQARQDTLHWLRALQPSDWQRPARHSIFGLTTLLEMAHFTAQHDRLHINQLCQTLGRCK